ncbi:MAG TPA: hypothetical protein VF013_01765 [Candidatus Limnocylindria bacterium]
MDWRIIVATLVGYTPIALLFFAPACGLLARRRNRDAETWLLLGAVAGPIALAWIALLPARMRPNAAEALLARRQRTPPSRIPSAAQPSRLGHCLLCGRALADGHACRPEEVEDRIQRRWTVRVGGQRIIGPL